MKKLNVKVVFVTGLLGTKPNNQEIFSEFIASNAPDAKTRQQEIEDSSVSEVVDKSTTVFARTKDGRPVFMDYHWKGYFKEKCSFLKKNDTVDDGSKPKSASIKAFKKEIDGNIFVYPRKIVIHTDDELTINQRPLRTQTMQGERVALNSSEEIHARSWCEFTVECEIEKHIDSVREWLNYGVKHGTGQWRNSGAGRFLWMELDDEGNQIGGNYTEEKLEELIAEDEL
jgi:hypothetical protein